MLTTLGFVLNKKNVLEYNKEYCFFTKKYGKICLLAKSVRKPLSKLSAQLEPPSLIEIVFVPNNEKGLITVALAKKSYFKIRKNLDKLKTYLYICRVINTFTDFKHPDISTWNLLYSSVRDLEKLDAKIVEINFLAKFLKILGFTPNISNCINCQTKIENQKNIYFDKERWGFCCDKCKNSKTELVPWQTFKAMDVLIKMPLKEIYIKELNDPIILRYKDIKNMLEKYFKQIKKYF